MSDTADADRSGDRSPTGVVPTIGFLVAAMATVGPLLALQEGATGHVIRAAAVVSGLAALSFLVRRHGAVARRIGAPVAAVASGVALVLIGYALAIGAAGSVAVVFGSFLAAGLAVGIGVADYAGVSGSGLKRRGTSFVEMLVVGFFGLLATTIVFVLLQVPALVLVGELTNLQQTVLTYVASGAGLGAVAIGYLAITERGLSYVDLEVPALRAGLWIVGGVVAVVGANVALSAALTAAGAEQASHGMVEDARENVEMLVVIIPAMLLIVGPGEELLYRNVVQKRLYGTFSRYGAVVVASVIFAAVHLSAYATAGAGQVLTSLVIVFSLSLVLGTIYERTENVAIPALVHGVYNMIVFGSVLL